MWNIDGCPRCGGDTYFDEDVGQVFEKCLQCGFERELMKIPQKNSQSTEKEKVIQSLK